LTEAIWGPPEIIANEKVFDDASIFKLNSFTSYIPIEYDAEIRPETIIIDFISSGNVETTVNEMPINREPVIVDTLNIQGRDIVHYKITVGRNLNQGINDILLTIEAEKTEEEQIFAAKITGQFDIEELEFLAYGAKRVSVTFGEITATPTMILTLDKNQSDKFFASDTASSHFSPFNNCLIIGPKGQNVDVIAHELVHAEIYSWFGWLTQILKMPRWFEEGVSLMVDFREPFLPENISMSETEVEAVKELFYGYQFYDENAFNNYRAARLAVNSVDKSQFYVNLERMKKGQSFDDVFGM